MTFHKGKADLMQSIMLGVVHIMESQKQGWLPSDLWYYYLELTFINSIIFLVKRRAVRVVVYRIEHLRSSPYQTCLLDLGASPKCSTVV